MLNFFDVKFKNYYKTYLYKSNLNLIENGIYKIIADDVTEYETPVEIIKRRNIKDKNDYKGKVREITSAKLISAPKRKDSGIKEVFFNEDKRTTCVLWKDGTRTIVKCNENDSWDKEKALSICYMKKFFDNKGYFNEVLKKYCK